MPKTRQLPPWLAAALLALCILAGCGPGVGGTGTGIEAPPGSSSPAVLAALCDSDLAPLLRCSAAPGTAAAALGTALVWLADGASTRNVQARVEGNGIDVEFGCSALQFSGTWGASPPQGARFHGQLRNLASGEAYAATLLATKAGTGIVVQLFDGLGREIGSPAGLNVMVGPVPLEVCR